MVKASERIMLRAGVYYCRFWAPADVAHAFGKTSVVSSLRTRDPKIARSRLARKTIELEAQFDRLRQQSPANHVLPSTSRAELVERAREHADEIADRVIIDQAMLFELATADPSRLWNGELTPLPSPEYAEFGHFDQLVTGGDLESVIAFLQRFRLRKRMCDLAKMRVTGNLGEFISLATTLCPQLPSGQSVVFARMLLAEELRALQEADADIAAHELAGFVSEPAANGSLLAAPDAARRKEVAALPVSLDELFRRRQEEADPSASTLSTWRGVVKNLKGHLGPKANDIRSVDSDDIVGWKDKLVKSGKSVKTISNGYLACARVLFRFAIPNKLADNDPTEGVKVSRKAKAGKKMLGYDNAEVARLLELASAAQEPWKRWLPWLAASTGSRIGEVAQLHRSHVLELEGTWVVKIAPAIDGGSIKNPESERFVPLHPKLIADGFLDFVKMRGDRPLFYNRTSGDPKRKHASKGLSNRLAAWIRENGFTDPRKAPNHALRHWFKSEAARIGIADSVADTIQGHSDGRASTGYRHIPLQSMASAIEAMKLPPVSRTRHWPPLTLHRY